MGTMLVDAVFKTGQVVPKQDLPGMLKTLAPFASKVLFGSDLSPPCPLACKRRLSESPGTTCPLHKSLMLMGHACVLR